MNVSSYLVLSIYVVFMIITKLFGYSSSFTTRLPFVQLRNNHPHLRHRNVLHNFHAYQRYINSLNQPVKLQQQLNFLLQLSKVKEMNSAVRGPIKPVEDVAIAPFDCFSQVLKFKEPTTNVTVVLIGAMHYNPASIRLTRNTIKDLAQNNALGSVVVEQCDIRWNKTNELMEKYPLLKSVYPVLLANEMRTACNVAIAHKRPVVLGDQRIDLTAISLKKTLKDTLINIFTPLAGWKCLYEDIKHTSEETLPTGSVLGTDGTVTQYLNIFSILDPRLVISSPVAFIRYPLSFFVRNPITTTIVCSAFFMLNWLADSTLMTLMSTEFDGTSDAVFGLKETASSATNILAPLLASFLETVIFARLLLKPMLAERNIVLAQNILKQCELYQTRENTSTMTQSIKNQPLLYKFNWLNVKVRTNNLQQEKPSMISSLEDDILYAPEVIQAGISTYQAFDKEQQEQLSEKTVVAVLGMAHCNGIMKLLKEEKVL